jgi:hypothetical protein
MVLRVANERRLDSLLLLYREKINKKNKKKKCEKK